jgi:L-lactate dehydrogenase complex protein LldG
MSNSRDIILGKIKDALQKPSPKPFASTDDVRSFFHPQNEELGVLFAQALNNLDTKFIYCEDDEALHAQLNQLIQQAKFYKLVCNEAAVKEKIASVGLNLTYSTDLSNSDASITSCECAVARTGTLVLSSANEAGRTDSVYAPVHICLVYTHQLVYDVADGLEFIQKKYGEQIPSFITFASGPSRTADIEKTLVKGIHGPKEVFVFLIES